MWPRPGARGEQTQSHRPRVRTPAGPAPSSCTQTPSGPLRCRPSDLGLALWLALTVSIVTRVPTKARVAPLHFAVIVKNTPRPANLEMQSLWGTAEWPQLPQLAQVRRWPANAIWMIALSGCSCEKSDHSLLQPSARQSGLVHASFRVFYPYCQLRAKQKS